MFSYATFLETEAERLMSPLFPTNPTNTKGE